MPSISLDEIRADIVKKYEPYLVAFDGGQLVMRQAMRLSSPERAELKSLMELVSADDVDEDVVMDLLGKVVVRVAENRQTAHAFLLSLGEDERLVVLSELVNRYAEATQVGEASSSAS